MLSGTPLPALALLALTLALTGPASGAEPLPADYSSKCVKDTSKPYSTENYQDCKSGAQLAEGRTDCCKVGGDLGCCKPPETGRMLKIAFGIIGVAIAIGLVVYICTWCDRETWPCIGRIEDAWRPHQHKLEESMICCRDRVERRRLEQEHRKKYAAKEPEPDGDDFGDDEYENIGGRGGGITGPAADDDSRRANLKLDAPQEFKAKVQDSWF